jgi:hypothetical protein
MDLTDKVGFAIGTGRCGTLFLHQLLAAEPEVASAHERNPESEAFHRYCMWHDLPIDDEGFLAAKEKEIRSDLERRAYSFEATPHCRFREGAARALRRQFLPDSPPDGVVTSFVHKGFYRSPYVVRNVARAAGYQDQSPERFFTFFARISPKGERFRSWNALTQVGKVAWFWNAFNERTLQALQELPEHSYRVVRIEDFNYSKYLELSAFLGFRAKVNEAEFDALKTSKPHAFWRKRHVDQWTEQEVREFESQVQNMAERFGYEYRIARLADEARAEKAESVRLGRIPEPKAPARFGGAPRLGKLAARHGGHHGYLVIALRGVENEAMARSRRS